MVFLYGAVECKEKRKKVGEWERGAKTYKHRSFALTPQLSARPSARASARTSRSLS